MLYNHINAQILIKVSDRVVRGELYVTSTKSSMNPSLPKSISYLPSLSTMYSSSTKYIHMQEGFAGGRLRATFEANARRQRKITAKGSLRCQGPPTNIPINPGRLEKLILRTDCVYIVNGRRDLNHDYGNASEPFPDVRHCVSCWE